MALNAREQSAAAEEMNSAMDRATKVITAIAQQIEEIATAARQQQANSSQNVSDASKELSFIAQNLVEQVKVFKI